MAKKKDELEEVKKKAEKDKENLEKMEKARKDTKRKAEKKIEELNEHKAKDKKEQHTKEKDENDKIKDDKVNNILKKAKEQGSITYGDLAKELDDVNPEQIDKVFDAFEALGVNLSDDLDDEEPDIEDLKEVEYLKLDEITDQYIELLNKAQELNLEVASEFLSLASTLLYIKSKKLLPSKNEEEEELSEDELIRRIVEYKKYKDITVVLRQNFEENANRFYKLSENIELPKQQLDEKYEENIIPNLYKKLWDKNQNKVNENAKNIEKIAITDTYTVVSKVKEMFKELIRNKSFVFNKLFSIQKHNRQEVVTAFSGLLELSRRSKVETEQDGLFGDINVKRKK